VTFTRRDSGSCFSHELVVLLKSRDSSFADGRIYLVVLLDQILKYHLVSVSRGGYVHLFNVCCWCFSNDAQWHVLLQSLSRAGIDWRLWRGEIKRMLVQWEFCMALMLKWTTWTLRWDARLSRCERTGNFGCTSNVTNSFGWISVATLGTVLSCYDFPDARLKRHEAVFLKSEVSSWVLKLGFQ